MQHSKKLLAAAVAGAFAMPGAALAQSSVVQIGGSLHMIYGLHNPHNPSDASKHDNLHMSEPDILILVED